MSRKRGPPPHRQEVSFAQGLGDESDLQRRAVQMGEAAWTIVEATDVPTIFLQQPVGRCWSRISGLLHLKGDLQII